MIIYIHIYNYIYIYIRLLQDCFHCYSQQIVYAVVKKSLIVYNIIQRAPEPLIL